MLFKILIFILLIINLDIPITDTVDFFIIGLIIILLISSKKKSNLNKKILSQKYNLIFILILIIINFSIPKLKIEESHSIFLNMNDIEVISQILPKEIITNIKLNYSNFDYERLSKAHPSTTFNNKEEFLKYHFIKSPYAFSSDSFFQNQKYSRINNKINFNSREDLRIGHINSLDFNLIYDKELRRALPYYVLFEIPKLAKGSSICTKGNFYYHLTKNNDQLENIKNLKFTKKTKDCLDFEKSYNQLYLIGYSINQDDNLSAQLNLGFTTKILNLFIYLVKFLLIVFVFITFFKIKIYDYTHIYILSFASTIAVCFLKDFNIFTGLRYFRGGADGLTHFSFGKDILENFANKNFLLALKGGEDIFYNMPGQRFFVAFSNMIFGDTSYGYLLITSVLPLLIYIFFKKYLNKTSALILLILFIFLPIFENMGFGYFNYIHQTTRNHAETLSIFLILLSFVYLIDIDKNHYKIDASKIFIIGFLLACSAILRPNFFLTTSIIIIYSTIVLYREKKYIIIPALFLGYAFFLMCLLHNVYYANSFVLFSNSFNHFNFPVSINTYKTAVVNLSILNFKDESFYKIIAHFLWWNPIYNIHRVIIIFYIIFSFVKYRQTLFSWMILFCLISQHALLFISKAGSRYAYLAWLLTFILFVKLLFDQKIFLKINIWKKIKKV